MNQRESNLEIARAVEAAFGTYCHHVLRQEAALGSALSGLGAHSKLQANDYLTRNAKESPSIRALHWVDPQGNLIESSDPRATGVNVADRDYYREIISGKPWSMSNLLTSKVSNTPIFIIARRIEDDAGKFRGIVLAEIEPSQLSEFALRLQRTEAGAFTVFDRQGTLVFIYPKLTDKSLDRDWRKVDSPLRAVLDTGQEAVGESDFSARRPMAHRRSRADG